MFNWLAIDQKTIHKPGVLVKAKGYVHVYVFEQLLGYV